MLYLIPGLGADKRVFSYLSLNTEYKIIEWEKPFKNESIRDYCKRLLSQINLSEPVILAGVSFGGIIAQEIATLIDVKKIILISSVKAREEMPLSIRLLKYVPIYKLTSVSLLKRMNILTAGYYFGITNEEEKKLLHQIILDTDPVFMKWATACVINWERPFVKTPLIHLHGTDDRIFPIRYIKEAEKIKGGKHLMIVTEATQISAILQPLCIEA